MKVSDLFILTSKTHSRIAYDLNITYSYLSRIKNRRINNLSRDLQLKIRLFNIENELAFDQKLDDLQEGKAYLAKRAKQGH